MTTGALADPAENLAALVRCASVTPVDDGALDALAAMLTPLGFAVERMTFEEPGAAPVGNLHARRGDRGKRLLFAGHTDVVPPGNPDDWSHPPFAAEIADGMLYGRGAVDMKGAIACFVAAVARLDRAGGGRDEAISLLVTGDEEAEAVNGTIKLAAWAAERGERWEGCIVGEPTCPEALGETIKIGRRGSLSGVIAVHGVQGHVAYPERANNPLRLLPALLTALTDPPFDAGSEHFPPTRLEVTSVDTGNRAANVIPASAAIAFNIRFNDRWTVDGLKAEARRRLDTAAPVDSRIPAQDRPVWRIDWKGPASPVFLTHGGALVEMLSQAIAACAGRRPARSTAGGTSDARFIRDYCPVVEFGLVGRTMHMTDERVALADLETLTEIYRNFLGRWFG